MNQQKQIFDLIEDFQAEVKFVAEQFYYTYGRKDLLKAWHDKTIPQTGQLNQVITQYAFHGAGLFAKLKDKEVDFDFGPNCRIDGFDAWRLRAFADSQTEKYQGFWTLEKLENELEQLERQGLIIKLGDFPGSSNYYRKENLTPIKTKSQAGIIDKFKTWFAQ
ncbi:MAG: hypothetical protein GC178_17705 [Flavobacteriales bacterium]|nr:hypothetical protein [Flavobacteriales bacterium]